MDALFDYIKNFWRVKDGIRWSLVKCKMLVDPVDKDYWIKTNRNKNSKNAQK